MPAPRGRRSPRTSPLVKVVDLRFVPVDQAWAVATRRVRDEEVRDLYATEDGGRHWVMVKAPNA